MAKPPKRPPNKAAPKPGRQAADISDLEKPGKAQPADWPPAARPTG